jgi:hypothetical protein
MTLSSLKALSHNLILVPGLTLVEVERGTAGALVTHNVSGRARYAPPLYRRKRNPSFRVLTYPRELI